MSLSCLTQRLTTQVGVIADDCAYLTTLKVRGCPKLTDKTIEYISKGTDGTAGLHKLQTLTLDAPNITGNNLELLVGSCSNLESLTLSAKEPSARMYIFHSMRGCFFTKLVFWYQLHSYQSWPPCAILSLSVAERLVVKRLS